MEIKRGGEHLRRQKQKRGKRTGGKGMKRKVAMNCAMNCFTPVVYITQQTACLSCGASKIIYHLIVYLS